ncbi:MAG: hypothetical protein KGH68_01890 [Patescibacteria group bacterium]|nr:hypothetical protein [Patescibacteria group bacterium]
MEREARRRSAWGMYAASVRQDNFDRQLADHDRSIKRAGTDESRTRAEVKRQAFIRECQTSRMIHIG